MLNNRKSCFFIRRFKVLLLLLFISNFSALAQKTTIWVVNHAEADDNGDKLSDTGLVRAKDLMKTLDHSGIQTIYTTNDKVSMQTANPLAAKIKLLPRIYTDSVQKLSEIIKRNFVGKKVLIIADYKTILPLLSAFGADSPFDELDKDDYDQLFTVTIKPSGDVSTEVRYYGKKHHVNAIPQSYIIDNFTQGVPGH